MWDSLPDQVKPIRCPAELLVDSEVQPEIPEEAGFPRPQTDGEKRATATYLAWLADLAAWGRAGWERSNVASDWCKERERG